MDRKTKVNLAYLRERVASSASIETAIRSLEKGIKKLEAHNGTIKAGGDAKDALLKAYEDLSNAWVGTDFPKMIPHIFELKRLEQKLADIKKKKKK